LLSYSSFSKYITCPKKFLLSYGHTSKKRPPFLLESCFGSAIQYGFEAITQTLNKEIIQQRIVEFLDEEISHLPPLERSCAEISIAQIPWNSVVEKGIEYFSDWDEIFSEQSFSKPHGDLVLVGRLDFWGERDAQYVISDGKATYRAPDRVNFAAPLSSLTEEDFSASPSLYQLLWYYYISDLHLKRRPVQVEIYYWVTGRVENYSIEPSDLERLQRKLDEVTVLLSTRNPSALPGWWCKYCPFNPTCMEANLNES